MLKCAQATRVPRFNHTSDNQTRLKLTLCWQSKEQKANKRGSKGERLNIVNTESTISGWCDCEYVQFKNSHHHQGAIYSLISHNRLVTLKTFAKRTCIARERWCHVTVLWPWRNDNSMNPLPALLFLLFIYFFGTAHTFLALPYGKCNVRMTHTTDFIQKTFLLYFTIILLVLQYSSRCAELVLVLMLCTAP